MPMSKILLRNIFSLPNFQLVGEYIQCMVDTISIFIQSGFILFNMATQKYHHGDFTETIEKSFFYFRFIKMSEKKVILVTGGTGLVGKGIEFIATGEEKCADEEWHFLSSKDGDLSYVSNRSTIHVYKVLKRVEFLYSCI